MSVQDSDETPLIVEMTMHVSTIKRNVDLFNVCCDSMQTGNISSLRKQNIKTKTNNVGWTENTGAELFGHWKAFQEKKPNTDCKELK